MPESPEIYLPSLPGPTVVVWDAASEEATCIDLRDGQSRGVVSIPARGKASIRSIDVSSDGKYLAAADVSRKTPAVRLWSFESKEQSSLTIEKPECCVVRFLPGHRLLAAQQSLPDLRRIDVSIWNAETKDRVGGFSVETGSLDKIDDGGIAVSPGGKYAAIYRGGNLFVYELTTGNPSGTAVVVTRLPVRETCRGMSFSPDGKQLAAIIGRNSEFELYRWDFATGELLGKLLLPYSLVTLDRIRFATCPDLQWTPSGWLVFGQTFTDGVGLGVSEADLAPQRHWLDKPWRIAGAVHLSQPAKPLRRHSRRGRTLSTRRSPYGERRRRDFGGVQR